MFRNAIIGDALHATEVCLFLCCYIQRHDHYHSTDDYDNDSGRGYNDNQHDDVSDDYHYNNR